MAVYEKVVGDRSPALEFTLYYIDTNGKLAVFDLTGCTASMSWKQLGQSTTRTGAMTVVSPATSGQLRYAWTSGDAAAEAVDTTSVFVTVTLVDGTTRTWPSSGTPFQFSVNSKTLP